MGPPAGAAPRSFEQTMAELESMPLFMKSLPKDASDDPAIAALQALVHEGTPDEIARTAKENGNDYFKGKRHREALGFYTQGLDAQPEDAALREQLYSNRAACNLELKNYGSVLRDCAQAISINPRSSKAFYRSALALIALERFEEAIDACDRCLSFDDSNASVRTTREDALKLKLARDEKRRIRDVEETRKRTEQRRLVAAYKERGILPISSGATPNELYAPHFTEDGALVLPVFFLYSQYNQSDTIAAFDERNSFADHLEQMFPPATPYPDWDVKREYEAKKLQVYAITKNRRTLKVGRNMTLVDVFKAAKPKSSDGADSLDGLQLQDGYLTFEVLPKGHAPPGSKP